MGAALSADVDAPTEPLNSALYSEAVNLTGLPLLEVHSNFKFVGGRDAAHRGAVPWLH